MNINQISFTSASSAYASNRNQYKPSINNQQDLNNSVNDNTERQMSIDEFIQELVDDGMAKEDAILFVCTSFGK